MVCCLDTKRCLSMTADCLRKSEYNGAGCRKSAGLPPRIRTRLVRSEHHREETFWRCAGWSGWRLQWSSRPNRNCRTPSYRSTVRGTTGDHQLPILSPAVHAGPMLHDTARRTEENGDLLHKTSLMRFRRRVCPRYVCRRGGSKTSTASTISGHCRREPNASPHPKYRR